MKGLTRAVLDTQQCANPGCDHTSHEGLVLSGRCHVGAPTVAVYQHGVLSVSCYACGAPVVNIAVAAGPHEDPHHRH